MVLQIFLETGQNVMEEMQTVRYEDFEVGQGAELGETDTGKLVFDDPGGLYTLIGWRHWRAIETTASPTLIASGRIMGRTITRGDAERSSLRTGADRQWDCDACDENILLGIRVIRGTAANRPAETAGERLRWLLSTSFTTLIDNGHITYPTDRLDAHDYTGENDKDLIASCAAPGGYNYFAVKDTASSTTELFFMLPTSSSWQSTIRISNDIADVDDVTTFEANYTLSVRRTPERIAEGVFLPYAGGSGSSYVYVSDSTIGDQYAYVDKVAPMAEVHTSAKATVVANRLLADSDEEDDRITGISISVPAAQVNDLRLWHRVQLKLTHVPGYEIFRWCRVLHRSVKPEGANYRITMELVPVEEQGASSSVVQTVTLSMFNDIFPSDSVRNASAVSGPLTFTVGQVWRWTITNNQHTSLVYTDALALRWGAAVVGDHVVRAFGVSSRYSGPDLPTIWAGNPPPCPPCASPFPADTGTFTITVASTTGVFDFYASTNIISGPQTQDEGWTCVLERLS